MIYHIIGRNEWQAAQTNQIYTPPSIETEGFIHFSDSAAQLKRVAEFFYAGRDDLLLLFVDETIVADDLKYEDSHGTGELFPHLYRSLHPHEVIAVHPMPLLEDGTFDPVTVLKANR